MCTNLAEYKNALGRTSAAHEHIVDILDDWLAFGYLYESELAANPDLLRLRDLAAEVTREVCLPANVELFPHELARRRVVCQVMNRLQQACRMNGTRPVAPAGAAWDALDPHLTVRNLRQIHMAQTEQLATLLEALVERIDATFPFEAKPFVTRAQVVATLRVLLRRAPADYTGPLHVDLLVALAHQEFLAALDRAEIPLPTGRAHALVLEYVSLAERAFADMARDVFVDGIVARLRPRAHRLQFSIDRCYPWGALWRQPPGAHECLALYARLNLAGALRDVKYCGAPSVGTAAETDGFIFSGAEDFMSEGRNSIPRLADPDDEKITRFYFTSDDTELRINNKTVQKHALMAVRYDRPLSDIKGALLAFETYLIRQRTSYCARAGEALNAEESALARRRRAELADDAKPARAVLHDKSSVLAHVCTLMELEMQRDPKYMHTPKKTRLLTIAEWIREAGFKYGSESIRKSCARGPATIAALRKRFARA